MMLITDILHIEHIVLWTLSVLDSVRCKRHSGPSMMLVVGLKLTVSRDEA